jgi:hypothetical protein
MINNKDEPMNHIKIKISKPMSLLICDMVQEDFQLVPYYSLSVEL